MAQKVELNVAEKELSKNGCFSKYVYNE
jgi:hypothetical protein